MSGTQPAMSGLQPVQERRLLPVVFEEIRESGAGDGQFIIRGHSAVYNKWSLDLGGFREKIMPGFFDEVLAGDPDVHLVWDHDTRWTLARTRNKTLEIRSDPAGLHEWARVAPTSYAADLRILMERRDIDQQSFAFMVKEGGSEWKTYEEDGEVIVERTLLPNGCAGLFDLTITAQGAYPQTDANVVANMRSRIKKEIKEGHLPEEAGLALEKIVAPDEPVDETEPQDEVLDSVAERIPAPETVEDTSTQAVEEKRAEGLRELKAHTRTSLELTKRRLLDAERERER